MGFGRDHHPANLDISSAPRNGLSVFVGHEDCGEFIMHWEPQATNGLLPGRIGFWVSLDRAFTWAEHDGAGPDYWRPLAPPAENDAPVLTEGLTPQSARDEPLPNPNPMPSGES